MKRQFKTKRQQGFTLLETLLSVAIMVIISTMLLNGFAATMGYSYHTSVYSKSAASNYGYCMTSLSDLHSKNTPYEVDDEAVSATSTSKVKITFNSVEGVTQNAYGVNLLNPLNATEFAYTAVPTGIDVGGVIENDSVAANRRTFFYYPTWNYDPSKESSSDLLNQAYLGHVNIYLYNAGTNKGKYVWGYLPDEGDLTSFVAVSTTFSMGPLAEESEESEEG